MKLKKLLFIGCIFYLLAACAKNAAYQVDIKLSNLEAQDVYAVFEAFDGKHVDTIVCQPSETISIIRQEGTYTTLTLYFENHKDWITVYLEPHKKITVSGDALYPRLVQIKGTRTNERLSDFRKKAAPLLKEKTELSGAIDPAIHVRTDNNKNKTEHTSRLANIDHELTIQAERFIRKHPDEEASAVLIQEYFLDPENPIPAETLINTLDPKLNDSYVVKNLKAYCQKAKQTMIGVQAPDFEMTNIYGTPYTRHSFTGKYCLFAFTATWCDMCQIEKMMLDQIAEASRSEALEILLVSLDEDPQKARDFIKDQTIRWNICTDSAGQAIRMFEAYNVSSLPRCFVLDKNGTIVLKTDNGIELKQGLETLGAIPKIEKQTSEQASSPAQ